MQSNRNWIVLVAALTFVPSACSTTAPGSTAETAAIKIELGALEDARNRAADRGDADAALAFISRRPEFRYELNGQMIRGFEAFAALVRRSYAERKSMATKVLAREVIVLSSDTALVLHRVQHSILRNDGSKIRATARYRAIWVREAKGWRVIHESEIHGTE